MDRIEISTNSQSIGIRSYFLSTLQKKADLKGKTLKLLVFKINKKALDFYLKHKLEITGESVNHYILEYSLEQKPP